MREVLVDAKNLKKYFPTGDKDKPVKAVDDVSFQIFRGETLGVVGESGCGKSTLGRTMIHLLESTGGQILFNGEDITKVDKKKLHALREQMQIIFQDPYSSLNPRMTVFETVQEPLIRSKRYSKKEVEERAQAIMTTVGLDERLWNSYPHELDGGRRQRIGVARAIALDPSFIVCDEPVSALDVSIQAQILNLMQDLQEEKGLTYMFITHDLSVVRHISTHICVMYLGQLVETCPSKELFKNPMHPYTKALLSAVPSTDILHKKERILLRGELVSPINPKPGCRFAARCNYACDKCHEPQVLEEVSPGHFVSCCRAKEING